MTDIEILPSNVGDQILDQLSVKDLINVIPANVIISVLPNHNWNHGLDDVPILPNPYYLDNSLLNNPEIMLYGN